MRHGKLTLYTVLLLCTTVLNLACRPDDSQSKFARATAQLAQVEDRVAEAEAKLSEAQQRLSETEEWTEKIENQLDTVSNERDQLQTDLTEAQQTAMRLERELTDANDEIRELLSRLDAKRDNLPEINSSAALLAADSEDDLQQTEALIEELYSVLEFVTSIEYYLHLFVDDDGIPTADLFQYCGDGFYVIDVVQPTNRTRSANFTLPADCQEFWSSSAR